MTTISLPILLPLITCALWLLALLVLAAHRLRSRFGLTPLLILLGGLAGLLQFEVLGFLSIEIGKQELVLQVASFVFLPTILLGLLIIYVVEGSFQARSALLGIIAVTVIAYLIKILTLVAQSWGVGQVDNVAILSTIRQLIASTLALTADLFVLVIIYQWVSNLRKKSPSILAVLAALLASLWCDAVVYATIFYLGQPVADVKLLLHLVGKTYSGLILTPLVGLYIKNYARSFPNSAVSTSRPVLDIFTTSQQFEQRARYNYNLLQTLLKINHQVGRAANLQSLLDQACQLLASNRDYPLVYIYLAGGNPVTACAGKKAASFLSCMLDENGCLNSDTPAFAALNEQKPVVINQVKQQASSNPWAQTAFMLEISSIACFPLLHERHALGVMVVGLPIGQSFESEEVNLLRDMVDDLANAITNFQLRQEQTTLTTAAETMPDGLIITNRSGIILYANSVVSQVLRVGKKDLVGESVTSFLPVDTRQPLISEYVEILRTKGNMEIELNLENEDGNKYPLSIRAAVVYDQQQTPRQIVLSIRDITSYKQYEHQLLALNKLITDLVQHRSKDELLPLIFSAAEELLSAQYSAIYLVDSTGKIIEFITHNLPDAYVQRIAQGYRGLPGETVFKTHQAVFVCDVLNDQVYQERVRFMADHGIHALLVLPILDEERIIGALVVYHDHPYQYSAQDVQLGLTLAHTVAIALQNIHLYQAEHSQRQLAEVLANAAASLSRLLNPDEVLDQILEQTIQITSCSSTNIMLIEGDTARLARRRGYAEAPIHPTEYENFRLPLSAPTIHAMYESGEPLLIANTLQDENWSPVSRTEWIRSYAGAPLKVSGQVVGFLNVDSDQPNAFNQDTIKRLRALADHASIAINNAELYSETSRQAQELSTLVQSAAIVTTSLDFNQVLDSLSKQIAHLVQVQGCAISVYDPVSSTVTLLAYYVESPLIQIESWYRPFKLDDYPLTKAVLFENTVIQIHANDPQADPAEVSLMREAGAETLLMLPLVVRDETLGLVELESLEPGRVFTQREIALLQTLGANAANAIQNARLYSRLQEYAGLLERRVEDRTAELRSTKEHIESILASIPDALFVLDDSYQPIRANQAGEELILQALSEDLNLFEPDFLDRLRVGCLPSDEAILRINERSYQPLASPFPVQPERLGLVVVFRDVTRFRELDEIKTHFVSDVSHELRTPLTNIMLYLDLLAAVDDPRKGTAYITTLQRETKRLGFLIEDLLAISRLEAGRVNIAIKPVNVNNLIIDLVTDRTMLASSRELTLSFLQDETLPLAMADPGLLNQAISNLLTNAINYTPAGGAVALSSRTLVEDGINWVTIDITDTGVGISDEELNRIFERFYRGSASRQTGAPGTGLGLAIAQEIATHLNGKVSVNSQPGIGSTFTFWLRAVL